jgi:hypothetical protein
MSLGACVEIRGLTLSVDDDLDGTTAALRGWLESVEPGAPWRVCPPAPSEGQGIADSIELALESTGAFLEVYDHVRQWIGNRGKRAKPVTAQAVVEIDGREYEAVVEIDGKEYELVVKLNPLERGNGRAS